VFLAGLPDLSEESLQLLDARFGSVTGRTSQPIAEALTKAVLQGRALQANGLASGLANWSASLRGIGNQQNRGAIFAVLVRQALPSVLRREFESLPLSPGVVSLLPSMGRHASEFAERLVDPLARVEAGSLSAYATAVAELAPATKACAVPMLAYLQSEQRDEVQLALFALGELGNEASGVMEAIAACLAHGDEEVRLDAVVALARLGLGAHRSQIAVLAENGPPAVRTLASFVLASTADGVLPNETLLEEAAGLDRRRALVATVALASRTVTSGQVAALLVREDRPSTWADHWLQRSLLSAIGRQMTSRPVDAQAIAYLRELRSSRCRIGCGSTIGCSANRRRSWRRWRSPSCFCVWNGSATSSTCSRRLRRVARGWLGWRRRLPCSCAIRSSPCAKRRLRACTRWPGKMRQRR
jgi:hypothetical protein